MRKAGILLLVLLQVLFSYCQYNSLRSLAVSISHQTPAIMLLIMALIAAILLPAHHKLEEMVVHRIIVKNKKLRLQAAKKTIAMLEKEGNAPTQSSTKATK